MHQTLTTPGVSHLLPPTAQPVRQHASAYEHVCCCISKLPAASVAAALILSRVCQMVIVVIVAALERREVHVERRGVARQQLLCSVNVQRQRQVALLQHVLHG